TPGTFSFTTQVKDAANGAASKPMSLSVTTSTPAALSVTTTSVPGGTVGVNFSATLQASGGTPPYNWSVSGNFPPGLVLQSSGAISGNPSTAGVYSFTAKVSDSAPTSATAQLSINILPPAPANTW